MAAAALRIGTGGRVIGLVVVFVGLVAGGHLAGSWLADVLRLELTPRNEPAVHRLIMWSIAAYGVLVAIPFVPGIEIAVGILVVGGPVLALLLYAVTVAGLMASFLVGHCLPGGLLARGFGGLRLRRAERLAREMDGLDREGRLAALMSRLPGRLLPKLLRHRYLAVAVLVNLPGNMVIGGGGGIALMAGLSKLYSPGAFLVTLALAVAPLPLAVAAFGLSLPSP